MAVYRAINEIIKIQIYTYYLIMITYVSAILRYMFSTCLDHIHLYKWEDYSEGHKSYTPRTIIHILVIICVLGFISELVITKV